MMLNQRSLFVSSNTLAKKLNRKEACFKIQRKAQTGLFRIRGKITRFIDYSGKTRDTSIDIHVCSKPKKKTWLLR